MSSHYYEKLSPGYLAHYCRRLSNLIIEQSSQILNELGVITPTASISSLIFLKSNNPVSVAALAEALGVSHQMATQRVNQLEKLGLVERIHSKGDKRVKQISLTQLAQREIKLLKPFVAQVDRVCAELNQEIDCELMPILRKAELALLERPLNQRINSRRK